MVLRTQQRCCARKLTAVADSVRPSLPLAQARARELSLLLAGLAEEAEWGERRRALEPDIETGGRLLQSD